MLGKKTKKSKDNNSVEINLKMIDECLALVSEILEEARLEEAEAANKYHSTLDWEYDLDPIEA